MIVPALLLTLGVNALGVIEPKFFQYAIDWYITPAIDQRNKLPRAEWAAAYSNFFRGLGLLSLVFLGVKLLQLLVSYFQAVLLESVGQRVMYDLRAELYEKLQRQEVAYFDRNPVGRIMTRLTSDVDSLERAVHLGRHRGLGRRGDGLRHHRLHALDGLASDARRARHRPAPLRGDHLVPQARAARLRPRPHEARAHQLFPSGAHLGRADRPDFQPRGEVAPPVPRRQRRLPQRQHRDHLLLRGLLPARGLHRLARRRAHHLVRRLARDAEHAHARSALHRRARRLHPIFAATLPAHPRHLGQVQHLSGGARRLAPHLPHARPARRRHDAREPEEVRARARPRRVPQRLVRLQG
jgi:hypothetical protein